MSRSTGYLVVHCPEHPRAWSTGYVYVHVVVAEQKLGRLLHKGEVVHHRDENKLNNTADNIEVKTNSQHVREHNQARLTLVPLVCSQCSVQFDREKRQVKKGCRAYCSRACAHEAKRGPRGRKDEAHSS